MKKRGKCLGKFFFKKKGLFFLSVWIRTHFRHVSKTLYVAFTHIHLHTLTHTTTPYTQITRRHTFAVLFALGQLLPIFNYAGRRWILSPFFIEDDLIYLERAKAHAAWRESLSVSSRA